MKAPLRALRHLPDRLLHGRRRRRALEWLSSAEIRTAVFICHGNINRSAYAAAAFEREIPEASRAAVQVRSAGFIGADRPASELAQSIAARRALDLRGHRSRLIDLTEMKETDLVVVMNADQCRELCRLTGRNPDDVLVLGDLDPAPTGRRAILDPYGHPAPVFEKVFDQIDRCVVELTSAIWPR
ncbi:MAG: hypothetical protein WD054_02775 [Gemmatimonadota bacterium]